MPSNQPGSAGGRGTQGAHDADALMTVEVCYALPDRQTLLKIDVAPGTTLRQAIQRSGIVEMHREIDLTTMSVGVFGKIAELDALVCAGDRIEIYRALNVDPKLARQRRVEKTRTTTVEGRRWVAKERRR